MNELKKTLFQLGGQESTITVHRALVEFTDDLRAGMMLSQLMYWHGRSELDDWTCAKSDEDFQDELCLTQYGVRKARGILEDMGIVETTVQKFHGDPTTHYRLDVQALLDEWRKHVEVGQDSPQKEFPKSKEGDSEIKRTNSRNQKNDLSDSEKHARAHNADTRTENTAESTTETTSNSFTESADTRGDEGDPVEVFSDEVGRSLTAYEKDKLRQKVNDLPSFREACEDAMLSVRGDPERVNLSVLLDQYDEKVAEGKLTPEQQKDDDYWINEDGEPTFKGKPFSEFGPQNVYEDIDEPYPDKQ